MKENLPLTTLLISVLCKVYFGNPSADSLVYGRKKMDFVLHKTLTYSVFIITLSNNSIALNPLTSGFFTPKWFPKSEFLLGEFLYSILKNKRNNKK